MVYKGPVMSGKYRTSVGGSRLVLVDGRGWKGKYSITDLHMFLELSFPQITFRTPNLLTNMYGIYSATQFSGWVENGMGGRVLGE